MIDALHADSSCDSPVVTRTTGGARYTGLNGTIIAVSCVSKDAWTGAVDGVSPSFSMYKVMLHPVDQPSALRCAVLNRTQDGSLRLYWGNYYACPRFDSTRQLTASRSTGAYKPSVDTVEAVSEVAHSCAMVTEAEGPAAGSLPPLAAVPFEEQFDGRVSPELWDASVSTYDRLSYRPRINGSSPDDQEAVVGPIATQAYLQTPPLLMSASAGGGNAMFKIEKLVLPLQRAIDGQPSPVTPLLSIAYSTTNSRSWSPIIDFKFNNYTGKPADADPNATEALITGSGSFWLQGGLDIVILRIEIMCEPGLRNSSDKLFIMDGLTLTGVVRIGTNDEEPTDTEPFLSLTPAATNANGMIVPLGTTSFERGFDPIVFQAPPRWTTGGGPRGGNMLPLQGSGMAVVGDEGGTPVISAVLATNTLLVAPGGYITFYISFSGGTTCWPLAPINGSTMFNVLYKSLMVGDDDQSYFATTLLGRSPYFARQGWMKMYASFPVTRFTYLQMVIAAASPGGSCGMVVLLDMMRFSNVYAVVPPAAYAAYQSAGQSASPPPESNLTSRLPDLPPPPMDHSPPPMDHSPHPMDAEHSPPPGRKSSPKPRPPKWPRKPRPPKPPRFPRKRHAKRPPSPSPPSP